MMTMMMMGSGWEGTVPVDRNLALHDLAPQVLLVAPFSLLLQPSRALVLVLPLALCRLRFHGLHDLELLRTLRALDELLPKERRVDVRRRLPKRLGLAADRRKREKGGGLPVRGRRHASFVSGYVRKHNGPRLQKPCGLG